MPIYSYFYDSDNNDRPYSAKDFTRAFDIAFETGFLIRETVGHTFGFDIGGTNLTTIYEGKAIIEGHFIELEGVEIISVPAGTYDGQVVLQLDVENNRQVKIVMKKDRTPIQTASFYELPIYDAIVVNGINTGVYDKRYQGGAIPNNHTHNPSHINSLEETLESMVTWKSDGNGVRATMGKFAGTGKPVVLYLSTVRPAASSSEIRVWIQIDNW
jgi:hypothetical protein